MKKLLITVLYVSVLIWCTGCSSGVEMPYGSSDYTNGDWTVDELVSHFEEMGFSDVTVEYEESRYVPYSGVYRVEIEDKDSDSVFAEYIDFEKGEILDSWREMRITYYALIPTWTIENSPELAELSQLEKDSSEWEEKWDIFTKEHNGEYLEFDGTLVDWYDEFWYAADISFEVSFENSSNLTFRWKKDLSDLNLTGEYDYNSYTSGLISEGDRVHIEAKINYWEDGTYIELISFDLLK